MSERVREEMVDAHAAEKWRMECASRGQPVIPTWDEMDEHFRVGRRNEARRLLTAALAARPASAEPVAWVPLHRFGYHRFDRAEDVRSPGAKGRVEEWVRSHNADLGPDWYSVTPLYTTPPAAAQDRERCKWREPDGYNDDAWETGCGEAWTFLADGPAENHVRFCHGCGKPVEVVPFVPEPDEDDDTDAAHAAGATDGK